MRCAGNRTEGAVRLSGIGLLTFTVLVLLFLFWILRPDGHPLATQHNVPLCDILTPDSWAPVSPAGQAVSTHTLDASGLIRGVCEGRLPAAPRGAPGSETRPLARVMVTTEADLRYQNLGNSMGRYINTYVAEMKASGWEQQDIEGPWRRTYAFRDSTGETVLLIDDDGVFVWVSSTGQRQARLLEFAHRVTERLRAAPVPTEPG